MKIPFNAVTRVCDACLRGGVRTATVYLEPKLTVRASRKHRPDARDRRTTLILSIGVPNFAERKFIKDCTKAGEPFPVRKIQLRDWPKKK